MLNMGRREDGQVTIMDAGLPYSPQAAGRASDAQFGSLQLVAEDNSVLEELKLPGVSMCSGSRATAPKMTQQGNLSECPNHGSAREMDSTNLRLYRKAKHVLQCENL